MNAESAITGVILECGSDGRIRRVVHDGIGLASDELVGSPFGLMVAPSDMPKALDLLTLTRQTGAQFDWELHFRHRDQPLHVATGLVEPSLLVFISPSPADLNQVVEEMMRISNDQTNLIRNLYQSQTAPNDSVSNVPAIEEMMRLNSEFANMQREMARQNARLARLSDEKSLLLGMAAHDLRNPLSAIAGYAELLEVTAADRLNEAEQRMVKHMRSSAAYMVGMIGDILSFSQVDAGKLVLHREAISLGELVDTQIALNQLLAERAQVTLAAEAEAGLPVLQLDRSKMTQVLNNLISNAIKFSLPGTTVQLAARRVSGGVELEVADQGTGIPENALGGLFQPFSSSTPSPSGEKGTGLGLAICKRIVDGHGGSIRVASAMGQGTTMTIWLPCND